MTIQMFLYEKYIKNKSFYTMASNAFFADALSEELTFSAILDFEFLLIFSYGFVVIVLPMFTSCVHVMTFLDIQTSSSASGAFNRTETEATLQHLV